MDCDTNNTQEKWVHLRITPIQNAILNDGVREGHAVTKSELCRKLINDFGKEMGLPKAVSCCGDSDCPED